MFCWWLIIGCLVLLICLVVWGGVVGVLVLLVRFGSVLGSFWVGELVLICWGGFVGRFSLGGSLGIYMEDKLGW